MMQDNFEKMRIALRYWLYGRGYRKASCAMEFARLYHVGLRKDGITPEFHHQISVASYIRTLPGIRDMERTLSVALLHDVVEDYNVSLIDIETKFDKDIADSVRLLSKKNINEEVTPELYYGRISRCHIASIVKGSDRIHNVQTMNEVFSTEKKKIYIKECEDFILPAIKEARRYFPDQEPAYENIKLMLKNQTELITWAVS